jgi:hypothetical protein
MIPGMLLIALAVNAQLSFKNSKVVLANGDTLSGPVEIVTEDKGWWHADEYAGLSLTWSIRPSAP